MEIMAKRFVPEPCTPGQPRRGELESPRFVFRGPGGKMLGTFLASSATWHPGASNESFWELSSGTLFFPSDLTTEDMFLRRSDEWQNYMSSSQLTRLLRLRRGGDEKMMRMVKHLRVTNPINNLIMLLLGLPFILSRERNLRASASLCVLMVGAFFLFVYISRYLGLDPLLAAWLPILLFGPVAVVMLDSVKT